MNLKFRSIVVLIFSLYSAVQLFGQGVIVPGGVSFGGLSGLGSLIKVYQNTNGNYTGFFLELQSGNTFLFDPIVDEGVRTFFVSSNDPISLQAIQTHGYVELTIPNTYVFNNNIPFYVGLYTSDQFPQNGIYPDPLFGWARLVNNNGVINLLGGALEYGGAGIYAGTQTIIPIPEPSTLVLLTAAAISLGGCRWKMFF